MLLESKLSERLVEWIYAIIAMTFLLLSALHQHYPVYFNLYCVISVAVVIVCAVSKRVPRIAQQYLHATAFLLLTTIYGTIYDSFGIIQDAFLASTAICSLFFNVRLNLYMLGYTMVFYLFSCIFYIDKLISVLAVPSELSIRTVVLVLGQIMLTSLVMFINHSQQTLIDKNQSFMELLRIVEIKKQDAVAASKAKADFLANMSHEIRTPMNAIVGMTEMVLRDDISPSVRENARNIKSAGNALLAIVNDILDFSKIESGKLELIPVTYQPTSLVNDLINIISVRLSEKNLELLVRLDPQLPHGLRGDEIRIRQVLINLLTNAVKFTSAGHVALSIRCERQGERVLLHGAVSDTGSGIRRADIDRLFESFSQVDTRQNRTIEGTGLGLAICRRLLEQMGGSIHVESEYGKGSTFSFVLPQEIVDETPEARVGTPERCSVLYAEESALLRDAAADAFASLGVQAAMASCLDDVSQYKGAPLTHLFVSKALFDAGSAVLRQAVGDAKIIVIIGKNQLPSDYPDVLMLRRPLYSAVFASVLNDAPRPVYEADEFRESFIAPKARVLVVDDNAVNLKVVKGLLEPYQMQVFTALSGRECLKLLETERYDVIFMDHMMPELDGIDTLRLIRQMPGDYYQTVPVIALTANAVSGVREMFFREGFQDYVSKPIELLKLEKALKHLLPQSYIQKATAALQRKSETAGLSLADVDIARGLQSCGGNRANYLELLKVVCEDGVRKCALLRQYAANKDYEAYTIEAHALKSVAASIGAMSLSELAKAHEFAGHNKDYDLIDNGCAVLTARYEALLFHIRALLTEQGISVSANAAEPEDFSDYPPIDKAVLSKKLNVLRELIDAFCAEEAEALIAELTACRLSPEMRRRLGNVAALLRDFNYEDALNLLRAEKRDEQTEQEKEGRM